ncbi:MAG: hypothetical protein K2P93_08195 [Alphaproteobacteria bacterium]|nr:hypothetical protein [Alphaproteobacteria bacterium]
MSKLHKAELLNLSRLTLPFLIITMTFIGIAYTCGHALIDMTPRYSHQNMWHYN